MALYEIPLMPTLESLQVCVSNPRDFAAGSCNKHISVDWNYMDGDHLHRMA